MAVRVISAARQASDWRTNLCLNPDHPHPASPPDQAARRVSRPCLVWRSSARRAPRASRSSGIAQGRPAHPRLIGGFNEGIALNAEATGRHCTSSPPRPSRRPMRTETEAALARQSPARRWPSWRPRRRGRLRHERGAADEVAKVQGRITGSWPALARRRPSHNVEERDGSRTQYTDVVLPGLRGARRRRQEDIEKFDADARRRAPAERRRHRRASTSSPSSRHRGGPARAPASRGSSPRHQAPGRRRSSTACRRCRTTTSPACATAWTRSAAAT